jgi:hypothetical protein
MPVRAKFSALVQTCSEAHPASHTMGTGAFLGVKRPGRGVEHPPPSSAEVKERIGLLCIVLLTCAYFCYLVCVQLCCVCTAVLHTLVAGLLARSQYPEGPATGHLGTGFSLFPCV